MLLRDIQDSDVATLRCYLNGNFPFPDLADELCIAKKAVIENGNLIGAGIIRLTSEGILIMDAKAPLRSRVRAILSLADALRRDVKQQGMTECHVFVREPNVRKFLQRVGFVSSIGGDPMVTHF